MKQKAKVLIACLLAAVVLVIVLSGCISNKVDSSEEKLNEGRMSLIYNDGFALVWRDNETSVQYLRVGDGVCVMVNPDGTPYTGE